MLNKFALIAIASATLVGVATEEADAGPTASFGWHFNDETQIPNGACSSGGLVTQLGYYGEPAPRVGHTQDAALIIIVRNSGGSDCGPITAIPSFEMNAADIARDPYQDVLCEWVQTNNNVAPLPNSPTSGCSNTPLANPYNFKNVYGWAKLAPGEQIRIYLPVTWLRAVSPTTFTAKVGSNLGGFDPAMQFNIERGPEFSNFTTTNASNGTTVQFGVTHHANDVGDVVIEYGTSTSYSYATAVQRTTSSTSQQMTFVLPNLMPGTQYHYRVRYIVPYLGVTWTADRTFGTDPATIVLPPSSLPCWRRFGC